MTLRLLLFIYLQHGIKKYSFQLCHFSFCMHAPLGFASPSLAFGCNDLFDDDLLELHTFHWCELAFYRLLTRTKIDLFFQLIC